MSTPPPPQPHLPLSRLDRDPPHLHVERAGVGEAAAHVLQHQEMEAAPFHGRAIVIDVSVRRHLHRAKVGADYACQLRVLGFLWGEGGETGTK